MSDELGTMVYIPAGLSKGCITLGIKDKRKNMFNYFPGEVNNIELLVHYILIRFYARFEREQLRHATKQQISIMKSSTENPMIFPRSRILVNEIRLPSLFAKQVPLKPM